MTFFQFWLFITPCLPLILLLAFLHPTSRAMIPYLAILAPLPALLLSFMPSQSLELPSLFLGSLWGTDLTHKVFLRFTSLLWMFSACFGLGYLKSDQNANRFWLLWLMTLAGNLGLLISQDIISFYTFFALMTFSAYGLVIHTRQANALFAGRIYLVMAVLGEMMILAGLFLTSAASAHSTLIFAELKTHLPEAENLWVPLTCLFLGFGVKAGLPFLHMWLPLAHPVAPTPASAVLSGAMIKAGLFAWLSILPFGMIALPTMGLIMILIGLLAAFVAGGIGLLQTLPKAVLAYSSISQMGLITCALGAVFIAPDIWSVLLPTLLLFAFHHAIAKGALFLSVGLKDRYQGMSLLMIGIGILVPALSLIGVFNSGIQAKLALKHVLDQDALPIWLLPSITASALATTLLMFRFLSLLWKEKSPTPSALPLSMNLGWGGLVVICGLGPSLLIPELDLPSVLSQWRHYPSLLLVPGLTLVALYFVGSYLRFQIPAGDIIYPLIKIKEACATRIDRLTSRNALRVEGQETKPGFSLPTLIALNQAERTIQSYLSAFFGLLTLVLIVSLYALR